MLSKPILELQDLHVWYHSHRNRLFCKSTVIHAVNGASFSIMKGEIFALVGESGSGKSSVAMSILGFVKPTRGVIRLFDNLAWSSEGKYDPAVRTKIQPVFQDAHNSLNPRLRIGAAIRDGLKRVPDSGQNWLDEVVDLLKAVGLSAEYCNYWPHQLSGGQKQRVCLARALARQPKLMILDEPVSSQDLATRMHLLRLILKLKEQFSLTYLLISHDLQVVKAIADRIAVMKDGKIVELGEKNALFSNPEHPYTRLLLERSRLSE